MSDNASDKPFAPTEHKLREARKRGEVPTAADLPLVAASFAVVGLLWAVSHHWAHMGSALMSALIELAFAHGGESRAGLAARLTAETAALASAAVLVVAAVVGTLVKRLLTGPVMASKAVTPDLNRINPVSGLKRLLSRDTWVALLKSVVGALAVSILLGAWVWHLLPHLLTPVPAQSLVAWVWHHLLLLLALGLLIHALPSCFDVFYQRHSFYRRMRMDVKDLRDEHKQLEGQPEVKSERRQRHRELLQ